MFEIDFFTSDICSQCEPTKGALAAALRGRTDVKVRIKNVRESAFMAEAQQRNIRSLPTLVCNERRLVGLQTESKIRKWLQTL